MVPVAMRWVGLFTAISMLIAVPVLAAESLQAVLSIKVKEPGKEVPPRLVQEITNHVTHQIRDAQVLSTTGRGVGRFAMTVALPAEERLKFEKMVVELPTAAFSTPVLVESWNVNPGGESVGATGDTTAPVDVHFQVDVGHDGELVTVRLAEVPVKDLLAYLSRTVHLQYLCPDEIAARLVCAEVHGVSVEEFLKILKAALGVDLAKNGAVWVFSNKELK